MDTHPPYQPPAAPVADLPKAPGRFTPGEKILLACLVINSIAGFVAMVGVFLTFWSQSAALALAGLVLPVFGFATAALMLRAPTVALALGAVFYLVQCVAYFSPTGSWALRSGLNISVSVPQGQGTVVLNLLAIVLAFVHIVASANSYARSQRSDTPSVA